MRFVLAATKRWFCSRGSRQLNDLLKELTVMPREPKHIPALQKVRDKNKQRGQKYSSGTITLNILGSGARGAPKSLYVFTDQNRYMFNCGEGTQRLAHEHKLKLAKLERIFVTRACWENIGGLPGVSLTLQDIGVPRIVLHGPRKVKRLFRAAQSFIQLRDLEVLWNLDDIYEDSTMTVETIHLTAAEESTEPDVASRKRPSIQNLGNGNGKKQRLEESHSEPYDEAVDAAVLSYICRAKKRPGALLLEKCVEFGVKPGPLLGRLKSGEDITLEDGRVVKSCDVREPDDPGPIFIVVDCPSEEYIESLVENPKFHVHQREHNADEDSAAYCVVHFTPPHVMSSDRYRNWCENFGSQTHHIVANEMCEGGGSVAVHRIQHKLTMLLPEVFPLLKEKGMRDVVSDQETTVNLNGSDDHFSKYSVPMIKAETLLACRLRPRLGLDWSAVPVINPSEYQQEANDVEGFPEALTEFQSKIANIEKTDTSEFPQVLFLGTGSCIPNKTRNTSAILVHMSPDAYMLLDCSEGTMGQLFRFYGIQGAEDVLSKLKGIFLSHHHADHHVGLFGVLAERNRVLQAKQIAATNPLPVIMPSNLYNWVHEYNSQFESLFNNIEMVNAGLLTHRTRQLDEALYKKLLAETTLSAVQTVPVIHCKKAVGVRIDHPSGWSLVYSGDTMPCEALVELGKNCDLLIHEATMEDYLVDEARVKMHTTTSEAIEVGRSMGAHFTLLTHFSQRYSKLPLFNSNFTERVGIAFDNMLLKPSDLKQIPVLYSPLRLMFSEDYEDMQQKTAKKALRAEREKNKSTAHVILMIL